MKRRINIGAALMHEPELLIMDEPTVGIDPQSRNHILETVKELNEQGMTVIYTSHYMEEVEYLCRRIAIIDEGKLIASGTKKDLADRLAGGSVLKLTVDSTDAYFIEQLKALDGIEKVILQPDDEIHLHMQSETEVLAAIIGLCKPIECENTQYAARGIQFGNIVPPIDRADITRIGVDGMKSLLIAGKDVKILLKDRKAMLMMIVMPIVLTAILGSALKGVMGGEVTMPETVVGVYSYDANPLATSILRSLGGRSACHNS